MDTKWLIVFSVAGGLLMRFIPELEGKIIFTAYSTFLIVTVNVLEAFLDRETKSDSDLGEGEDAT